MALSSQHNDTQHNDTQHNDTQHNDAQHNDIHHNDTKQNDTLGYYNTELSVGTYTQYLPVRLDFGLYCIYIV